MVCCFRVKSYCAFVIIFPASLFNIGNIPRDRRCIKNLLCKKLNQIFNSDEGNRELPKIQFYTFFTDFKIRYNQIFIMSNTDRPNSIYKEIKNIYGVETQLLARKLEQNSLAQVRHKQHLQGNCVQSQMQNM